MPPPPSANCVAKLGGVWRPISRFHDARLCVCVFCVKCASRPLMMMIVQPATNEEWMPIVHGSSAAAPPLALNKHTRIWLNSYCCCCCCCFDSQPPMRMEARYHETTRGLVPLTTITIIASLASIHFVRKFRRHRDVDTSAAVGFAEPRRIFRRETKATGGEFISQPDLSSLVAARSAWVSLSHMEQRWLPAEQIIEFPSTTVDRSGESFRRNLSLSQRVHFT